jgi:hypothetical protein
VVAIGTDQGLYLSNNYGESFELFLDKSYVSTAVFSSSDEIIVGINNNEKELVKLDLTNNETTNYELPKNVDGNISFITINYEDKDEIAFATYQMNIYVSKNNGENWDLVVKTGAAQTVK